MRQPLEIRPPAVLRVYVVCFGVPWVGLLVAAILNSPLSTTPIAAVMIVVGLALVVRMPSLKVIADASGVLIRNFYRTWRFRWAEVEDFRLGRATMAMPFGKVIHMLLKDGEVVTMDVTATGWGVWFGGKERREQMLQRLRKWLPPRA